MCPEAPKGAVFQHEVGGSLTWKLPEIAATSKRRGRAGKSTPDSQQPAKEGQAADAGTDSSERGKVQRSYSISLIVPPPNVSNDPAPKKSCFQLRANALLKALFVQGDFCLPTSTPANAIVSLHTDGAEGTGTPRLLKTLSERQGNNDYSGFPGSGENRCIDSIGRGGAI